MSVTTIEQITTVELLSNWLAMQVNREGFEWLKQQQDNITSDLGLSKQFFFAAFSAVPPIQIYKRR